MFYTARADRGNGIFLKMFVAAKWGTIRLELLKTFIGKYNPSVKNASLNGVFSRVHVHEKSLNIWNI